MKFYSIVFHTCIFWSFYTIFCSTRKLFTNKRKKVWIFYPCIPRQIIWLILIFHFSLSFDALWILKTKLIMNYSLFVCSLLLLQSVITTLNVCTVYNTSSISRLRTYLPPPPPHRHANPPPRHTTPLPGTPRTKRRSIDYIDLIKQGWLVF